MDPGSFRQRRPRKQSNPSKYKGKGKVYKRAKKNAEEDAGGISKKGPIWTRPAGNEPLHPELDKQLAKPFLATIYIDATKGIRFPLGDNTPDALMTGLHKKMLSRYFRGISLPEIRMADAGTFRLPSSRLDGSRADRALEECIRTGREPPKAGKVGCSEYATAVWEWWRQNNHTPVLAQLPVVFSRFHVATAGDYFTVHTCPFTQKKSLWLWELKTGWPMIPKKPDIMSPPLAAIWLTPENRWQLQVLLTKLAYERELGINFAESGGGARVIHVWKERIKDKGPKHGEYECKVHVVEPADLKPANWTEWINHDTLYESLSSKTVLKK